MVIDNLQKIDLEIFFGPIRQQISIFQILNLGGRVSCVKKRGKLIFANIYSLFDISFEEIFFFLMGINLMPCFLEFFYQGFRHKVGGQ